MQGSRKADSQTDECFKSAVVEPCIDLELVVNQFVAQVEKMVGEFGDPALVSGFNSRQFINQWLELHVPALGGKPSRLLGTREGCLQVQRVLDCFWSGAYA